MSDIGGLMTQPHRRGGSQFSVLINGEFACFTRPEMKIERVSYPVMTPSSAKGILEAIFWKPLFKWHVRAVWILKPVRWFSVMRSELKHKISLRNTLNWQQKTGHYDISEDRTMRHTLGLRDVSYVIRAEMILKNADLRQEAAFRDQFRRRLTRGACFQRPYLGCREYAANFSAPTGSETPIAWNEDLGLMLAGMIHESGYSGCARPVFFRAVVSNGVIEVPRSRDQNWVREDAA